MGSIQAVPVSPSAQPVHDFLRDELRNAATPLRAAAEPGAPKPLRPAHNLQAWCESTLTRSTPAGLTLLLYFISRFLEDALENLTGDFRYDEDSDRVRRQFFGRLGNEFETLAGVDFDDSNQWAPVIERALRDYLSVVSDLNSDFIGLVRRGGD